ncbi:hypothetical protein [Blastococcus sp. SYSU D00813]
MSDDVDEIAVERACKGDRAIRLNRAEVAAAVRLCERRGLSDNQTAELLGITARSVIRIRHGETDLPYSRRGTPMDSTKDKIAAARQSKVPQVRRAAEKAAKALTELDAVLAEWDAKEQALERIAELERELAEAKAKLHGGKPAKATGSGVHAQARAWARQQGIAVPAIGLVSRDILDAWRQATGRAA